MADDRFEKLQAEIEELSSLELKLRAVWKVMREREIELNKSNDRALYSEELIKDPFYDRCMGLLVPLIDEATMEALTQGLTTPAKRVGDGIWKHLGALSIQSRQETKEPALAPEETIKARREQHKAVHIALAVHALLEAANLPEDVSAAEIARFIARLAGLHSKTFEPFVNVIRSDQSLAPEQYEFVANLFDELKLDRLAKDVRKNIP